MKTANKHPHPTKPGKFISRQRAWQIKQSRNGRCQSCGDKAVSGSALSKFCARCIIKRRVRLGVVPRGKTPSGIGRPRKFV